MTKTENTNKITNEIVNATVNIKVIGVSGGGNNVIRRLAETLDLNMELIAVNTDSKQLNCLTSDKIKKYRSVPALPAAWAAAAASIKGVKPLSVTASSSSRP